ncbi:unnamed protein product [Rhodiola kirilowii]
MASLTEPHRNQPFRASSTQPPLRSYPSSLQTSLADQSLHSHHLKLLSPEFCFPISTSQFDSSSTRSPSSLQGVSSHSGTGFPSTVRISSLNPNGNGGGPAFVGQVFSMCDLSGTGLMAVSNAF